MANFLLILDQEEARRTSCAVSVSEDIAPFPDLKQGQCSGDGWTAVWAASHNAPVDYEVEPERGVVLWGDAIDDDGIHQTAQSLRKQWEKDPDTNWDGYYAAIHVDCPGKLTVSTDILGVFPIYYWQGHGITLVGSSPQMFFKHPDFKAELDLEGLVGILLNVGLVNGRTLLSGVKRLEPGCQLRVREGKLFECRTYFYPKSLGAVELPFKGHVEFMHEVLGDTVRRHAPSGGEYGLMLSGGLDSRMLAGYMSSQGSEIHALTFGRKPDIELACASSVARFLNIKHQAVEIPSDSYPDAAEAMARWEFLSAGFNSHLEWGQTPYLKDMPSHVMLGHMLDGVIGGIHIGWDYDPEIQEYTFEKRLGHICSWGFEPEVLKSILVPEAAVLVDMVLEKYRQEYMSYSDQPYIRAQIADLRHRQRLHVGSAAWVTSFASWPIVPSLDRKLMAAALSLPASSLGERRVQKGMAVKYFPELSALPLDRNSSWNAPLRPRVRYHLKQLPKRRLPFLFAHIQSKEDKIFYKRVYDINAPGWQKVRELAEPHRKHVKKVVLSEYLREVLPPPDKSIPQAEPIKDSSRFKLLLGLALIGKNYSLC